MGCHKLKKTSSVILNNVESFLFNHLTSIIPFAEATKALSSAVWKFWKVVPGWNMRKRCKTFRFFGYSGRIIRFYFKTILIKKFLSHHKNVELSQDNKGLKDSEFLGKNGIFTKTAFSNWFAFTQRSL